MPPPPDHDTPAPARRTDRRTRKPRRLVGAVACVLATAAAVAGCATASARSTTTATSSSVSHSHGPATTTAGGRVLSRTIPGGASRFHGRPAEIYLPPRALKHPKARLPVVELLHGGPGAPTDWVQKGQLATVADSFAGSHHGAAPIIVMPDINGTEHGDTECIRTPGGADVEQYLAQIVPAWITRNLPATTDHHRWIVGGMSEGGTCAAMLGLRHPQAFTAFADFSGLAHLTLGDTDDPARTIRQLFGGSAAAYRRHDPLWLLQHGHVHPTAAWFATGASDDQTRPDQSALARAAHADGIPVRAILVPGGHHWSVWTTALEQMLPRFWNRIGS